jgi:hypothetical protein
LNISDEDEAENMTSKIPSVHPSDSSYCTKKQHMSDFKCTKVSTLCTPPKQMKKVSQKPIGRRTRLGVLTLFLNVWLNMIFVLLNIYRTCLIKID